MFIAGNTLIRGLKEKKFSKRAYGSSSLSQPGLPLKKPVTPQNTVRDMECGKAENISFVFLG